jgi:hypothetical protein
MADRHSGPCFTPRNVRPGRAVAGRTGRAVPVPVCHVGRACLSASSRTCVSAEAPPAQSNDRCDDDGDADLDSDGGWGWGRRILGQRRPSRPGASRGRWPQGPPAVARPETSRSIAAISMLCVVCPSSSRTPTATTVRTRDAARSTVCSVLMAISAPQGRTREVKPCAVPSRFNHLLHCGEDQKRGKQGDEREEGENRPQITGLRPLQPNNMAVLRNASGMAVSRTAGCLRARSRPCCCQPAFGRIGGPVLSPHSDGLTPLTVGDGRPTFDNTIPL